MNLRELKAAQAALVEKQRAFNEANRENWTAEVQQQWDAMNAEYDTRQAEIARLEQIEARAALTAPGANRSVPTTPGVLNADIGMSRRETQQYSITRAIRAMSPGGSWDDAGLELEASNAVAQRLGRPARGFYVPNDVLMAPAEMPRMSAAADHVIGTDNIGGYLVADELRAASFIDLLMNRMVLRAAGITVLNGLVGNVAIPKQTAGTTAYDVAEDGTVTNSAVTLAQVTLTPKTVAGRTSYSRLLLLQSSLAIESFVRNDLTRTLALALDYRGLHGTGTSNQATGVASTSGIGSVAGGTNGLAPTWAHLVTLETEVAQDNADISTMAYITNAKVRGKLKQTAKVASSDSVMIWADNATPLNGYPCYVTNQVSSTLTKGSSSVCSAIFFGCWDQLLLGLWGELDVLVNPYSNDSTGQVNVTAFQSYDYAVRYAQAFAAMLDALTA
ncbi:MAG: phage major capsid protein [Armatimonadota bacterium]